MPKPVRGGQRYLPGLDGLRAIAVLAVIAFHVHLGWAPGGLLGVGVFFTLSGYLITDLLLGQWKADGRLRLGDFWLRRARRLLPAVFVMLAVVTAWVTVVDRSQLAALRPAVAAAAGYVSNWYYIAAHSSYFARFAPLAPLDHLWSLAVEEQFYLAWPWLLWLGVRFIPRRRTGMVRWLALPTLGLAAASTMLMMVLYHPGVDPTRVYEGTDTRAFGLLIGAALAMVWPSSRPSRGARGARPSRAARTMLDVVGIAGLAVIGWLVWRVGQYSPFVYPRGLVVLSLATAGVLAAAAYPGSMLGAALGWRPLRWLGVRSYGIYLWHYPVIVLTSPPNSGLDLPRAAAQVAVSIALAAVSWKFIEEPIRQGAIGRLWERARSSGGTVLPNRAGGWAALTGGTGVVALACVGLAGVFPAAGQNGQSVSSRAIGSELPPPQGAGKAGDGKSGAAGSPAASVHDSKAGEDASLRTSCRAVVHIGDSTSEGMISPDYLPNPSQRLAAQYHRVGVSSVTFDISGARSVVETLPGQTNGYEVAKAQARDGYHGCWVIALGTNDTADVVVGSSVGRIARIERMMTAAQGAPVMWVDVKSLLANGPYAESDMLLWNRALRQMCAKYPNMRIYDWASVARRSWFINDGIHYTSLGYANRGRMIADALARAFPASGHSSGCVVS